MWQRLSWTREPHTRGVGLRERSAILKNGCVNLGLGAHVGSKGVQGLKGRTIDQTLAEFGP